MLFILSFSGFVNYSNDPANAVNRAHKILSCYETIIPQIERLLDESMDAGLYHYNDVLFPLKQLISCQRHGCVSKRGKDDEEASQTLFR